MKVAVFDTHVKKSNGNIAHFDIIVPHGQYTVEEVITFGRQYLESIEESDSTLTTKECRFCHIEVPSKEVIAGIAQKGFYILKMADIPMK